MTKKFKTFVCNGLIAFFYILAAVSAQAARPLGIDVYSGSGTINWSTVKSGGITFAWAKATEGTYYEDANFAANQVNGKAAGVYMGAYDFCRPDKYSPATEANYFWNYAGAYIKSDGKTFMPMLDFETFNGVVGASSYADWATQWCHDIETNAAAHGVNVTPVIYISSCNACNLNGISTGWGAWLANYNGESSSTGNPWNTCTGCEIWGSGVWDLWQFTSTAKISGVPGDSAGNCDEDVYNGTSNQLVSAFIVGAIAVTSQPTNVTVGVGGSATFKVSATGTGTLYYQWYFNQTSISGATGSMFSITNAQLTDAGGYSVLITNSLGSAMTDPAFLSVLANVSNSVSAPANMVNWWPADDTPVDIYGTNTATSYNDLTYTTGKDGQAFSFDGTSSFLLFNNAAEISPSWTVCMWVYRQNAPGTSAAIMGDSTYAIKLEQYGASRKVGITHSGVADYYFNYSVPQNTWTHLAIVDSGSQIQLYINGTLNSSQLYSNSVAVATPSGLPLPRAAIGVDLISGSETDFMKGDLDEIQTFHSALSGAQISAIYSAGSAGLVRAPEFTGVTPTGGANFQLNLRGQTGKSFTLYYSTDLLNWTSLGTISNPTGATSYTGSTTSGSQGFYRVSQP